MNEMSSAPRKYVIPIWFKLSFTSFMLVFIPVYWKAYGPTVFLYFCDIALLLTLVAMWTENRLLLGMAAVGIMVPQLIWIIEFLFSLFGMPLLGTTEYMFNPSIDLLTRAISLFHGWLPILLIYLIYKMGYPIRAFLYWNVLAFIVLNICYFLIPEPTLNPTRVNLPVNINYVFGFSETAKQQWIPDLGYFLLVIISVPTIITLPAHYFLDWVSSRGSSRRINNQ